MPNFNRMPNPKGQRRGQATLEQAPPVDFRPILPFLRERVGKSHQTYAAAREGSGIVRLPAT